MKAKKHILTSLVLGVLALRCGGETGSPQSGSESHFLDACENEKSDCGPGLACVCGICTRTCESNSDCSELSGVAACVVTSPICKDERRCEIPGKIPRPDGGHPSPNDGGRPKPIDAGLPTPNDAAEPPDARDATLPIDGTVVMPDALNPVCSGGTCFCDNLVECARAEEQTALPLGSTARRICGVGLGTSGRYCLVTTYSETEGGLAGYRCEVPYRATCDAFSPASMCVQVLSCNLLMQTCPQDPLDCDGFPAPTDAAVVDARPPVPSDAALGCTSLENEIVAEWA